jgi:hypothetical protein
MTIFLKEIWPIEKPTDYKVHFARRSRDAQPLEVFVRDKAEWQGWQEYWPSRNDFNRPLIFSLVQFYHETDAWLFGGVFRVLTRHEDRYEAGLLDAGRGFIGRLKLHSPYRGRTTRVNFENHYEDFEVQEILREPYSGRQFPGYEDIDLSFEELETLVKNDARTGRRPLKISRESISLAIQRRENATLAPLTAIREFGRGGVVMLQADTAATSNCARWSAIRRWITAAQIFVLRFWRTVQAGRPTKSSFIARLSGSAY